MVSHTEIGNRIKFIRKNLKISRQLVADSTGLDYNQVKRREMGMPTFNYEEFQRISAFLDKLWQKKFDESNYPKNEGQEVKEVTPEWMMFGVNKASTIKNVCIRELKAFIKELETENIKLRQDNEVYRNRLA